MNIKRGDRVLAFDWILWEKAGGDIGDNSCFYTSATILYTYKKWNSECNIFFNLADVIFDSRGLSKGHFVNGLKKIKIVDCEHRNYYSVTFPICRVHQIKTIKAKKRSLMNPHLGMLELKWCYDCGSIKTSISDWINPGKTLHEDIKKFLVSITDFFIH